MTVEFTNRRIDSLVPMRHFFISSTTVYITVSPCARCGIPVLSRLKDSEKWRSRKIPYGMLRQRDQYDYCIKLLETVYIPTLSMYGKYEMLGTAELNERGNIHLHLIANIERVKDLTQLQMFRRDILNDPKVISHMRAGKARADYMNEIVYVTKTPEYIMSYLDKDYYMNIENGPFKNYIVTDVDPQNEACSLNRLVVDQEEHKSNNGNGSREVRVSQTRCRRVD